MPSRIEQPMLAARLPPGEQPAFPAAATPKLDGVRALKVDGVVVSRAFKPIANAEFRTALQDVLPDGADGEIVYGATFQECTSAVMAKKPRPGLGKCKFFWFDYVCGPGGVDTPYVERMGAVSAWMEAHADALARAAGRVEIVPLYPTVVSSAEELAAYEGEAVGAGFEGVVVRKPHGKYKFGRSTLREGLMLKIKRFQDAEAEVVGFEELRHNGNQAGVDAFGYSKRGSHRANRSAAAKLGALSACGPAALRFNIGTGFTDEMRARLWEERDSLVGRTVKYKFFDVGVKTAPRHPVFLGFRSPDDM